MLGLRRAEGAVLAYVTLATLVAAWRAPRHPNAWFAVAAHLLIGLLLLLTAQASQSRATRRSIVLFRDALPLLLLLALYPLLDIVNLAGNVRTWDAPIQHVEQWIFHGQPARDWWRTSPSTFWSTLLHGAYFSYYALIAVPAGVVFAVGTHEEQQFFVTRITYTFMLCYAIYALLPVSGPYYQFALPTGSFVDNAPARLVYASLKGGSSFGAAFPSSHVAATIAVAALALRLRPRLGAWLILPAVLLTVSVVYCAMHYAVDAIAGFAVGALVGGWPRRERPRPERQRPPANAGGRRAAP